eukprot:6124921-Amphidinium_carterae.1
MCVGQRLRNVPHGNTVSVPRTCVRGMVLPRARLNESDIGSCVLTEVDALLHEGTIPESGSRLTTADVAISVGH